MPTALQNFVGRGQYGTAQKELFAEDAINIEPYATPAFQKETMRCNPSLRKGMPLNQW